ncbi:unnamed protein product [Ixodes pacificus]
MAAGSEIQKLTLVGNRAAILSFRQLLWMRHANLRHLLGFFYRTRVVMAVLSHFADPPLLHGESQFCEGTIEWWPEPREEFDSIYAILERAVLSKECHATLSGSGRRFLCPLLFSCSLQWGWSCPGWLGEGTRNALMFLAQRPHLFWVACLSVTLRRHNSASFDKAVHNGKLQG